MMTLKQWREAVRDAIREFADESFQRRIWLRGEGPEIGSYSEAFNRLFDDADFERFLNLCAERNILSPNSLKQLQQFRHAVEEYSDNQESEDEAVILADPRWDEIRRFARSALNALDE